jgi:spermidine synthase
LSRVVSSPNSGSASGVLWTQLYLGLGFTTMATLILELALTRIFSVVFYYHFAFLAISIALFGLGVGGVFSYVVAARPGNVYQKLGSLALSASVSVLLVLWFILSRQNNDIWTLAGVYFATAVPFFLAGTIVSIAISEAIERVHRAYFFDLAGAAVGCLLLILFLDVAGGPGAVIAAAAVYAIAAALWYNQARQDSLRIMAVLVALLMVTLLVVNGKARWFDVHWAKGERIPEERFSAWNSFSRVGVIEQHNADGSPYWLIRIDADAATGIATYDWAHGLFPEQRAELLRQGQGMPYALRPGAKTLIIGPGGGYDVSRALASGSKDVTAVEINPLIANKIMQDVMVKENYGIYLRPEVHLHVEDGRSFVRSSTEKYQVLQATLVDTWASTAAGAFALSENNLYTSDAFYDYLSHLTDDGVLVFTRWGFEPPRESLRLVSLAMDALTRLGEPNYAAHIIAVRDDATKLNGWGAQDTVLISRKPFSAADIENARRLTAESHMDIVYLPGQPTNNAFGQLLSSANPAGFWNSYQYDVSPVGDDRPFFFYTVQPRDLWNFVRNANQQSADYKINRAVPLLFGLMGLSIVVTSLILVLPRLVLGTRLPKQKNVMTFLWYFLCLGAGYILVQVALIQKFVLLLGHPTYALTVIVFSMLVASGAGSYLSRRVVAGDDIRLAFVLAAVAVLVGILAFVSAPLVAAAAGWPLAAKVLLTTLSVAPAALLMGMPFPSGLRRLEKRHAPSVRWAWSLNAAASVLGSASAIFLAIYIGLRSTLLVGAALYVCALLVILATRDRDVPHQA